MEAVQTEGLTFEKVWAALMETRQHLEETGRKMEETDRQIEETSREVKETTRQMKETDKKIGYLSNRFGELAEHLVLPSIQEKFNALGFTFTKTGKDIAIKDALDRYQEADIDILLENGDFAIAIEVKAKTAHKDVERHKERMAALRRWADKNKDKRKFYGAMAGAIMTPAVKKYAQKAGFYTIVQSGDTVKIDVPEGFNPKKW